MLSRRSTEIDRVLFANAGEDFLRCRTVHVYLHSDAAVSTYPSRLAKAFPRC